MLVFIICFHFSIAWTIASTVTCDTKFSSLIHSISKVICPPNCPLLASSTLCGSIFDPDHSICRAAMHEQLIDVSGGLVEVYRVSGQTASPSQCRNGITSVARPMENSSFAFAMTCSTHGDSAYPVTQVNCPPNCRGGVYPCGTGLYDINSSVCAAAAKQGLIEGGGQVTLYKYTNGENIGENFDTKSCNGSWFTFASDIDECSGFNPCQNGAICVDLLAGYQCICAVLYGGKNCQNDCSLGVRNISVIPDSAMTASSYWNYTGHLRHYPWRGRLDFRDNRGSRQAGNWHAGVGKSEVGQWLQVALQKPTTVMGVVTQGRANTAYKQWVASYIISYLPPNATIWKNVTDSSGRDVVFIGNNDNHSKVSNKFPCPIVAEKLRIYPQTFHGNMALRLEYLTC